MATYRMNVGVAWPGLGGPGLNTWHFRSENSLAHPVQEPVDSLKTFYTAIASLYMTGAVISSGPEIIEDPYGDNPQYRPITPWVVNGSGGNRALAPTALTITWRTLSATRNGRGRTFLGPMSQGMQDSDGTWVDSGVAIAQSAATGLVTRSTATNQYAFGVYSRVDGVLRDFTAARANNLVAVIRSRR